VANALKRNLWRYSIGDVGLELEFTNIDRNSRMFVDEMSASGLQVVHDASNETPRLYIQNLSVRVQPGTDDFNLLVSKLKLDSSVVGGEAITDILFTNDNGWKDQIFKVSSILSKYGETEICFRDSLHVHVNVGQAVDHRILLRLLNMSMAYEFILYKLGGMGCVNRGGENSYIYQRPYTPKGPPVVKHDRYNYPIFYVEDLLNSKDKVNFFDIYGDSGYCAESGIRYTTQRYMGVNFYPIPVSGSIEFRHANKTLNPEWIVAWAEFCSAFVKKAFFQSPDETEYAMRPLTIGNVNDDDFINCLKSFAFLSAESLETLLEIWRRSENPLYKDEWTYTHLSSPTFYNNREPYYPKPIRNEEIVTPKVFTVHELKDSFSKSYESARRLNRVNDDEFADEMLNNIHMRAPRVAVPVDRNEEIIKFNSTVEYSILHNTAVNVFDFIDYSACAENEIFLSREFSRIYRFDDIYFYYTYDSIEDEDDMSYIEGDFCIRFISYDNDEKRYGITYTFSSRNEDYLSFNYKQLFTSVVSVINGVSPNTIRLYNVQTGEWV